MNGLKLVNYYGFGVAEIPGGYALFDYCDGPGGYYITGDDCDAIIQQCITHFELLYPSAQLLALMDAAYCGN